MRIGNLKIAIGRRRAGVSKPYSIINQEVTGYITGLTTPLSEGQIIRLDTFVSSLKAGLEISTLSDAFDIMYIFAGETEESSLKNIISNSYHCIKEGETHPLFDEMVGFKGNGIGYLNTNYKPKSNGLKFTLNNASIGIYSYQNISGDATEIGVRSTGNKNRTFINVRNSTLNRFHSYLNTNISDLSFTTNTDASGMFISSRTANNIVNTYKRNVVLLNDNDISSDLADHEIFILAMNDAGNPINISQKQISFAFAGRGLSEADIAIINDVFERYIGLYSSSDLDEFLSLGFGAHIGGAMRIFQGNGTQIDFDINVWNLTNYDINITLDALQSAGMKYAMLVAKTHEGWCLWPTNYTDPGYDPLSIAETAWYVNNGNPDIVKEFVDGCNARNIKPCIYFSISDYTHEYRTGTDETTDPLGYINMIKTQLTEILTNYGSIYAIWFDGWGWDIDYDYIPFLPISNHIKRIQPSCIVMTNDHLTPTIYSEVKIYETNAWGEAPDYNVLIAEAITPFRKDNYWIFDSSRSQDISAFQDKATILESIARNNAKNSTYTLGVYYDQTGNLNAAQIAILESLQT